MQWCPILLKNYPWLELIQLWHGVLLKHFKDYFLTLTGLNCSICNFVSTGTLQVRNTSGSSELLLLPFDAQWLSFVFPSKIFFEL